MNGSRRFNHFSSSLHFTLKYKGLNALSSSPHLNVLEHNLNTNYPQNDTLREREDSEQRELLKNCWLILKDSVIAPEQLKRLCNQLDNNCERLEQQT